MGQIRAYEAHGLKFFSVSATYVQTRVQGWGGTRVREGSRMTVPADTVEES
uniref:Uncharacterized protein n=1 Tax=Human betaherpesvirus 6 TaxID=10368 RepID=A0A649Z6W4_9BETA|nr:hypothetical protein [Human betaherpesvirus 6]QGM78411.1 hypothetical protein [Human betaherpesvirus 6]